eukprot:6200344-Pleurochrysis_carterae.AAC.2
MPRTGAVRTSRAAYSMNRARFRRCGRRVARAEHARAQSVRLRACVCHGAARRRIAMSGSASTQHCPALPQRRARRVALGVEL